VSCALRIVAVLVAFATASVSAAAELKVAAASDLAFVLPEIVAAFEKQSGATVKVSFGSSGNFTAQIQNSAPFDVFMAADIGYPRTLIAAGLADAESLYLYGVGRIVVWGPEDSQLNFDRGGMRSLLQPQVKLISIANPQHAPYGRAAVAALTHYGIYSKVKKKLVLGENIAQAAQFVQSGNAEAGIVALSLVLAPAMREKGTHWLIPEDSHPALEQGAIVLKSSTEQKLAHAFVEFLSSAVAREQLRRYGFETFPPKPRKKTP
jgi:molybdate transport system substrate-binding protein